MVLNQAILPRGFHEPDQGVDPKPGTARYSSITSILAEWTNPIPSYVGRLEIGEKDHQGQTP